MFESETKLTKQVAELRDSAIMKQLNWLVSRELIVIVTSGPKLLQRDSNGQISYAEEIELRVKDHEYIEKLEVENKKLRETMENIKGLFGEPK
ncbi:MAG TPA: hypothetical protein VMW91_00505 [Desulfosporosinus sp.]|nr:hypothetical protein [Desulfosporosinus sp.]